MEAGEELSEVIAPRVEPERVGSFLRARRLELGLTYADVANVVKLSPRRIELLENERWDELPDGPFLRGFLRNIARALDLDATSLTERVDASLMRSRTPESILLPRGATHAMLPRRSGPIDDRNSGRNLVLGACVFAVIAALIAWSGTDSFDRLLALARSVTQSSPAPVAARPAAPPQETVDPRVIDPQPAPSASAGEAAAVPATTATTLAAVAPPTAVDPTTGSAAAPSPLALAFHFNEECWVEVRSANGKILLQRLNAAGSDQLVDGEAPYSLIVGNAKGVELRFRGQSVDLAPHTRDQVARLTLS